MSRRLLASLAAAAVLAGISGAATAHASVDAPPASPNGVSLTDDGKGVSLTDEEPNYIDITKYCHYVTGNTSVTLRCYATPEPVNVWVDAICTTKADLPPVRISTDIMQVGPLKLGSRTAYCPKERGYALAYVEGIATERG